MKEFYAYPSPDLNLKEKSGVELELNYLGGIKNGVYNKKVKEALYDVFIAEEFSKRDSTRGAIFADNLSELKKQRRELYEDLKSYIESDVEDVFKERVVKDRHRYLKELSTESQFKIIEESQISEDPSDPPTSFSSDLHATIASKLELEDYSDLGYYSSVGSHLDYCGVDGFFKFKGKDEDIRVAFDLTMDTKENKERKISEKRGSYLADIVLYSEKESYRESESSKEKDLEMINKFADQIIEVAREKGL